MNQSGGGGGPLSADEILTALGSGKWPVFRMDSVGGSANAITASVSGLTLTSGQYFWLVPASNSSSTTVNLNLNSGGNVRVKKADGSTDPASGDLQAGVIALLYYDGTYYRQVLSGLTENSGQTAIFSRTSSDQTGISGSFVATSLDYNNEDRDDSSHWTRSTDGSGAKYTTDVAGEFLIIQHVYGFINSPYLDIDVNGTAAGRLLGPVADENYKFYVWRVTLGASEYFRLLGHSSSSFTLSYTDGSRPNKVNFIEIIRQK